MDMNLIYGILILVGLLLYGLGVNVAKAKGWINGGTASDLKKAEDLIDVIAGFTKKLTDLPDDDIDLVQNVIQDVIAYTIELVESEGKTFLNKDELYKYALDLIHDTGIRLSHDDKELIKSVIGVIYLYLVR